MICFMSDIYFMSDIFQEEVKLSARSKRLYLLTVHEIKWYRSVEIMSMNEKK